MGCWATKRSHVYMPARGDVGEHPCAKCPCSLSGDAYGKVGEEPQIMFPGWKTSELSVSAFLLKSIQTCIFTKSWEG